LYVVVCTFLDICSLLFISGVVANVFFSFEN